MVCKRLPRSQRLPRTDLVDPHDRESRSGGALAFESITSIGINMSDSNHIVLIAEDNPGLARVLSFKFQSAGFTPLVCADGQVAWEAFQTHRVTAVVSDQEMPRMSGVELCRNIRRIDTEVPLFLVTGRQLELSATDIQQELNISHIFAKPFSPSSVIDAVNQAIANASPATQPVDVS